MPTLHAIICSTRPGRGGPKVADWFIERARAHGKFDVTRVDLAEVNLPMLDEPNHPMRRQYTKEHTKAWSAQVNAADAFVFVTPEYNYGPPPALVNALNYLYHEWSYKPAGFVSYGGVSGGLRSVQMTKQIVTTLKMMAIPEGVTLPLYSKSVTPEGKFEPGATPDDSVVKMLDELAKWSAALRTLRA